METLDVKKVGKELAAPFAPDEIEWRVSRVSVNSRGPQAIVVPYVSSRAIQNRFDNVVGWDRWENKIQQLPNGAFIQSISIRIGENQTITKCDGADPTNFEETKGGISSALKRTAVLFGVGRYLYNLSEVWVEVHEKRKTDRDIYTYHKDKKDQSKDVRGYFTPPTLPNWALPEGFGHEQSPSRNELSSHEHHNQQSNTIPAGMVECIFKDMVEKQYDDGVVYEICFEQGGQICVIYAIGKMAEEIKRLQLKPEDRVAISSEEHRGQWVLNNVVKVG
ncbi:Rad52/Rad22 family DNA repair protein [Metabacillus endolithicus]|uniref:Rad52/Rad22 family DNA repair protein n=1 Tax=Metabacillus endolithicus TaxID=1535204 RepID=A0ABW5C6N0_9BACI